MRSVRHALGPSFGTLSFGAAVLTLVQLARNAMEQCAPPSPPPCPTPVLPRRKLSSVTDYFILFQRVWGGFLEPREIAVLPR